MIALEETLAAEVRSKFQTQKQMEFTAKGELVYVLFDETVVKYRWLSERSFEVVEILLTSEDRQLVAELLKILPPSSNEEGEENDLVSEPLKLIESLKTHSGEDALESAANETKERSFDISQLKPLLSKASIKDEEVAARLPSPIGDSNSNGQIEEKSIYHIDLSSFCNMK